MHDILLPFWPVKACTSSFVHSFGYKVTHFFMQLFQNGLLDAGALKLALSGRCCGTGCRCILSEVCCTQTVAFEGLLTQLYFLLGRSCPCLHKVDNSANYRVPSLGFTQVDMLFYTWDAVLVITCCE